MDAIGQLHELLDEPGRLLAGLELAASADHGHGLGRVTELEDELHVVLDAGEELAYCLPLTFAE
jgi:hypothetical protein